MGIIQWFYKRFNKKTYPPDNDFWYSSIGNYLPTASGITVDASTSVKYPTLFACIGLIAGDLARLPLRLYQHNRNGSTTEVDSHPAAVMIKGRANEEMAFFNYLESAATHLLLWGNHYGLPIRRPTGELDSLWPIADPGQVRVYRDKKTGGIRYQWQNGTEPIDRPAKDVFHIAGWGYNGLVGLSPISILRESVALGIASDEFTARFFSNSATPSMVISMPQGSGMDDEVAEKYLKAIKGQITGIGNAHTVTLLRNGEDVKTLTMPLKDAQFLESREFQKREICGIYRVPPHKVSIHGANSNYNSLVEENRSYLATCLSTWMNRIEQSFKVQLLTDREIASGLYFRYDTQHLTKGDPSAEAETVQNLVNSGVMTRNEGRKRLGLDPLPDEQRGDETILPLNYVFAKDMTALDANKEPAVDVTPEPEPDEAQRLIAWTQNQIEARKRKEQRSIVARDRISARYRPLILQAAQVVINREVKAIAKQIKDDPTAAWLDTFYQDMSEYIRQKLGPTLRSFTGAIADIAASDTGADFDAEAVDQFINDYLNIYVLRHIASSRGQIASLAVEENGVDLVNQRLDEWHEKRADKIATRETVQGSNATYQAVAFMAGFATVFRTRGKSCPYCTSLDGTVIRKGQTLVKDGQELKPDGVDAPMTFNGDKAHPPIHQGCDCFLTIG